MHKRNLISLSRLKTDRKGAVAAEFALVVPLLFTMLFAVLEYSLVLYTYGAMQQAARDVTRQVAVNVLTKEQGETEIAQRLPSWTGNIKPTILPSTNLPATNVYTTTVTVPINKASPISFFTNLQTSNIVASVQMKQELPFEDE